MAAPTVTARSTPSGIKIDDGHRTTMAFARDPDVSFWEKSVKPPGIDGGDAVETSTMHNVLWRTMSPRKLRTMTDMTCTAAYDPILYNQITELVNQEGAITVTFPDGSTVSFFGFLKSFEPGDNTEGEQPTCTITVVCTNQDPTTGSEQGPVVTSVSGT